MRTPAVRNKLILFDLDGTLVDVMRYHHAGFRAVVERTWGVDSHPPGVERAGIPQGEVMREVCQVQNVPEAAIAARLGEAQGELVAEMRRILPHDLRPCTLPGAQALLERLCEHGYVLGLITGTLGGTATTILERAGLAHFFAVTAFGDEAGSREEIIRLAVERGQSMRHLHADSLDVVAVGDAASDIQAARAVGARAVAVATGDLPAAELARHVPDALLDSLADSQAAFEAITGKRA